MDELKRLVQRVLEGWDTRLDSDESGQEYDPLADAMRQRLREYVATNP
jgi:hypothetical protein